MSDSLYRFVVKKTYMELLLSLEYGEKATKELSKKIGMAYYHLVNVINEFVKDGYIEKVQEKNYFNLKLTDKGKRLVDCFKTMKKITESKSVEKPVLVQEIAEKTQKEELKIKNGGLKNAKQSTAKGSFNGESKQRVQD